MVRLEVMRTPTTSRSPLLVEVGRARIRIEPGFDAEQLRLVVAALSAETPK